jgi:hypothetical protein
MGIGFSWRYKRLPLGACTLLVHLSTFAPALSQTFTVDAPMTVTGAMTAGSVVSSGGMTAAGALSANSASVASLSVTGNTTLSTATISTKFVIPTTNYSPSNSCTPGQLLLGPGGSDSNGKGGWFYFCRLGGTWAAADFSNEGAAVRSDNPPPDPGSPADEVVKLKAALAELRQLVCADKPDAAACRDGRR